MKWIIKLFMLICRTSWAIANVNAMTAAQLIYQWCLTLIIHTQFRLDNVLSWKVALPLSWDWKIHLKPFYFMTCYCYCHSRVIQSVWVRVMFGVSMMRKRFVRWNILNWKWKVARTINHTISKLVRSNQICAAMKRSCFRKVWNLPFGQKVKQEAQILPSLKVRVTFWWSVKKSPGTQLWVAMQSGSASLDPAHTSSV